MMKIFEIQQTDITPQIKFNPQTGNFLIKGKWIENNPAVFCKPIFNAIQEYSQSPEKQTIIDVYFNGCTHNYLLSLLKEFEQIKNSIIICNWYFFEDDENVLGVGQDYASILKYPFKFIEIKD